MSKQVITGEGIAAAIGPYSNALVADGWLYMSGQLPKDPISGELKNNIEDAARQCMENIRAILTAAGASFSDVVKTNVYMTNLDDFSKMNPVYESYLGDVKPCRTTIQVSRLPAGAMIEIDCVARLKK